MLATKNMDCLTKSTAYPMKSTGHRQSFVKNQSRNSKFNSSLPIVVQLNLFLISYCPEEDIVPPFVQAPPAPEPLPLPVPILREEIKPYPAPHEEYGPPPKCSNGAPDSAYPYCCLNGVNNPSCSLPTRPPPPPVLREEYGPPEIPHEEYGPPPKCTNGAPDWAYPYCCLNGVNNPTCSLPTTEAPLPPTPLPTFPPPPPIFTGPYPAPTTTEAPTTLPPTTLPPLRNAPYPAPVRSAPYPAPVRAAPYPGKIENSHYGDSGYSSGGSAGDYSGAVIVPAVRAPSQSVSYVSKPRIVLTKKVISLPLPNLGLIKKKLLGYVF